MLFPTHLTSIQSIQQSTHLQSKKAVIGEQVGWRGFPATLQSQKTPTFKPLSSHTVTNKLRYQTFLKFLPMPVDTVMVSKVTHIIFACLGYVSKTFLWDIHQLSSAYLYAKSHNNRGSHLQIKTHVDHMFSSASELLYSV